MKTAEDFKRQASEKNITFWENHDCSICGVPVGYVIEDEQVFYDSSCGCASSQLHPRTWDDIAYAYNRQTNEKVISQMNEFWGF